MGQSQLEPAPGDVEAQRFSFEAFTRHEFFAEVNRWIVDRVVGPGDRKSTRLNSNHLYISYSPLFFNDTAPTEIYPLSLHDALPICGSLSRPSPVTSSSPR